MKSVRSTITYGLAGVLALHLVVVVLNHLGLSRAEATSVESAQTQAEVIDLLAMNRDVVALQSDLQSYMYTGDAGLERRVRERVTRLRASLDAQRASGGRVATSDQLDQMIEAFEQYREGLEAVITDRGLQETVLADDVHPFVEESRALLARMIQAGGDAADDDLVRRAGASLRLLSEAESHLARYLSDPSGARSSLLRSSCESFESELARLAQAAVGTPDAEAAGDLEVRAEGWSSSVFRVVNSTRNYLHLVSVVLAGQAREFRVLAGTLTEGALAAQDELQAVTAASNQRFHHVSTAVGVLTVLFGLIAGVWIRRGVSQPIAEMTSTFKSLARGRTTDIPGLDRQDEIGELAAAAEVFAAKNNEVQELLDRANELARRQQATNVELESRLDELRMRNEDLDSFSYSASHDLRAPLRSIALLAEWIEEDTGEALSGSAREHLRLLRARTKRLGGLLDGLLDYARVGRSIDLAEPVDLRALAEETVDSLVVAAAATVTVEGEPLVVEAPRVAICKVIQNLVSNALSHHDREDPRVWVRVADDRDGFARVEVEDDGPGIDPELHEKVFQIFQTAVPRDQQESSGVGLAIVQRTVEIGGGTIELESPGGRGCKFVLRWPNVPAGDPAVGPGIPGGSDPESDENGAPLRPPAVGIHPAA